MSLYKLNVAEFELSVIVISPSVLVIFCKFIVPVLLLVTVMLPAPVLEISAEAF